MKLTTSLLCFSLFIVHYLSYADNSQLFNEAYQTGKKNQFNLNLNANSTINTYSTSNKLESTYINNANAGTQNSKQDYSGASNDKNYLYNKATKDLANCVNQNDPRCTTLNKYSDKDTQTTLQAYNHNVAQAYYIHTKADPSDNNCTLITTKQPVNATTKQCIAAAHQSSSCTAKPVITINVRSHECNPNGGGCNQYINNPLCTKVKDYVAPSCIAWSLNAHWFHHSGTFKKCHDDTVTKNCDINSVVENGDCGNHNQNFICDGKNPKGWNWKCTKYSPEELAVYSCREPQYSYSDECAGRI
jgi:hypothetical protein